MIVASRSAMIPDPTTAATSSAVPTNSATMRPWDVAYLHWFGPHDFRNLA